MLQRDVLSEITLVKDEAALGAIVAPESGPWARGAMHVQETIREITGVGLPVLRPKEVTGPDGLRIRKKFHGQPLILMGELSSNAALLEPHLRRWLDVDGALSRGWTLQSFPNPWGKGGGLIFLLASGKEHADAACRAFAELCSETGKRGTLILGRFCAPLADPMKQVVNRWRRLARPQDQDMVAGFKRARRMHLGYYVGRLLFEFTLITDLGMLKPREVNDIEQEVLENVLMIPKKVWWYNNGPGRVGGRHELFKCVRLLFAVEHLLRVGLPNDVAEKRLKKMRKELKAYLDYVLENACRAADIETDTGSDHAWMSALWYALATGEWGYFRSGQAMRSALNAFVETDNLGCKAGHFRYGGVRELNAPSAIRNFLRAAAWWYRDGRFKWLLENMPLPENYAYAFPLRLPLDGIEAVEPKELAGLHFVPISRHSYNISESDTKWEQPGIKRGRTFGLLTFRSGFHKNDQYLALDGYQNHFQPLGLCSVLRYVDHGKLFLVAHTGKEGNYYKSGVALSFGAMDAPGTSRLAPEELGGGTAPGEIEARMQNRKEPWGAELAVAADFGPVALAAALARNYHDSDWTRYIFWRRGLYFIFMDHVKLRRNDDAVMTVTWRTGSAAELKGFYWFQQQGDVSFYVKPAGRVPAQAGRAEPEEYQNEIVPYIMRQSLPISGARGQREQSISNLVYASSLGWPVEFDVVRISERIVMVKGTNELALMGFVPGDSSLLETNAAMFYLARGHVAIAGGSRLLLDGRTIIRHGKKGNYDKRPGAEESLFIQECLARLWSQRQEDGEHTNPAFPSVELKELWAFDGFKRHPAEMRPGVVLSEKDAWAGKFQQVISIAAIEVLLTGRGKGCTVELSNDGFKDDVRGRQAVQWSSRILGPHGKSFFTTATSARFPGGQARHVRVVAGKGVAIQAIKTLAPETMPADIVELKVVAPDGAKGEGDLLCRARDNQLALLAENSGQLLWMRDFNEKILCIAALDLDGTGKREIFVVDAASVLWRFNRKGRLIERALLRTNKNKYRDFFRFNRAYCLGAWRPDSQSRANLVMGTYQSVAWRTPEGRIVCRAPQAIDPRRNGFVWRGLVYWERTLERGYDFNRDGVDDQAFLARGWTAVPTLLFFDGKNHVPLAEYKFENGRTLGLEWVNLCGKRLLLAANEFKLGLWTDRAVEAWSVRFDTPAAGYTVTSDYIIVAKRDGMLLKIDARGNVTKRIILQPGLRAIAAGRSIMVAGTEGMYCLDPDINDVSFAPLKARILVACSSGRIAAALYDGRVVQLE